MAWTPPTHTPYQWQNAPSTVTPLDSTHLIAAEDDLVNYTQTATESLATYVTSNSAQSTLPTSGTETGTVALAAGTLYPFDLSTANGVGNLPHAPADGTRIAAKVVKINATAGTYTLTVNATGGDVFDITGGGTALTYAALHQGGIFQYQLATGIWYVTSTDAALGQALGAAKVGSDGLVGTVGMGGTQLSASVGNARSTDGTDGLPTPTGVGLELIIATVNGAPELQNIEYNGVAL